MRDNDYRRQQGYGRDFDTEYDRGGRESENWGANRQQGGYEGRSRYGAYSQQSQGESLRWNDPDRDASGSSGYGSGRFGGAGSSNFGGYGGNGRHQDDSQYGRQQAALHHGGSQHGGYADRFSDDYGTRQRGEQYGGQDQYGGRDQGGYGERSYGEASRFGSGMQPGNRNSQTHHDPDYHQWRAEQMRNLDNDYEAWRGERYKKFSEDFNEWRSKRPAQEINQNKQSGSANKTKDQS
ncbi:MAG: hypothetical protein EOO31_04955 [Comamonadaceae bacterium]|nr:MAG: hypothetical protein EOO31_04955 [Comamonadaceae bacterium]